MVYVFFVLSFHYISATIHHEHMLRAGGQSEL